MNWLYFRHKNSKLNKRVLMTLQQTGIFVVIIVIAFACSSLSSSWEPAALARLSVVPAPLAGSQRRQSAINNQQPTIHWQRWKYQWMILISFLCHPSVIQQTIQAIPIIPFVLHQSCSSQLTPTSVGHLGRAWVPQLHRRTKPKLTTTTTRTKATLPPN